MHKLLMAAVAALFAVAVQAGPGKTEAPDVVRLRFGWPDALQARSHFVHKETKTAGERTRRQEVTGSYRLRASRSGPGLRIDYDGFAAEVKAGGGAPARADDLQALFNRIGQAIPSIEVSAEGEFAAVAGLDGFRKILADEFEAGFKAAPSVAAMNEEQRRRAKDAAQAVYTKMMDTLFTREALEQRMADEWNMLVGMWIGGELEQDAVYVAESSQPVAALGHVEAPLTARFRYLGRAACDTSDRKQRCVRLEMRSVVESEQVGAAVEKATNEMLGAAKIHTRVKDFRLEQAVDLVTEPGTLIPHHIETRKTTTFVMVIGDETQPVSQVEESAETFEYAPPRAAKGI